MEHERRNVKAALKALEAERARLAARAEAEKQRLQKQVPYPLRHRRVISDNW